MRTYTRSIRNLCTLLILIAGVAAQAFAQGRGGAPAATNDFYRFNYDTEEMQPIQYPAEPVTTQHEIALHGETIQYTARAGFLPIHQATSGLTEGHLFYIYYSRNGVTDKSKRPVWFLFDKVGNDRIEAVVFLGNPLLLWPALLAVAVGVGVWLTGSRVPHGLTGPTAGVVAMLLTLAFGLAQWRDELRRGYYIRAQAAAPTKIWHQLVVYPVMGYWLWTATIGGLSAGGAAAWAGKVLLVALIGAWAATNVYDRRHPKLGHPPFDWRRARPAERPWAAESQTLQASSGCS